ncbi:DUF1330 domain-containing protein [Mucilaginibacter sp. UR6-1]|uniref:DUF1330 domain-containing protein n=1 Tax=Mucilaginibacter sp. UR6-1 TaxID=1435643 RepID=UPI001E3286E6|nr:DUF1330 domain-containing protein [Mucilaginibacter sp. UR6-1]MCC8409158.1 DUF1330 domain-containing protein [Mucilaginibacter sp. UR6-1]
MIKLPNIEPGQGSVLMLNMIKFRDKKIYFEQYIPAFNRVVQQLGIEGVSVKLVSKVVANIVAGEDEQWDEIVLVEYPNAEAFITIAQSDVYHEIANPLREAGTAELKLYMTRKIDF